MIILYYTKKSETISPTDAKNKALIRQKLAEENCRDVRDQTFEDFRFLATYLYGFGRRHDSNPPAALVAWAGRALLDLSLHASVSVVMQKALTKSRGSPKGRGRPRSGNTHSMAISVMNLVQGGASMTRAVQSIAKKFNKDESVVRKAYYGHKKYLEELETLFPQLGQ